MIIVFKTEIGGVLIKCKLRINNIAYNNISRNCIITYYNYYTYIILYIDLGYEFDKMF